MSKGPSSASAPKGGNASDEKDFKQTRRRLSVMSDNKLVEGFESAVNLKEEEEIAAANAEAGFIVNSYGGYSKKGYAPYNPKKEEPRRFDYG